MTRGLVVDLFAGGGGASVGIEAALGRPVDVAIDHDPVALAVHRRNHPQTRHLTADIWEVRPQDATGGEPVALLWASPECTHFSSAKGDVPRSEGSRSLAWAVVRWAEEVSPALICIENVPEFRGWGPLGKDGRPDKTKKSQTFQHWVRRLAELGYQVDSRVLDASEYGAPTRRRRLFIVARRDSYPEWPAPTHGEGLEPVRTAAECLDWSIPCPSIFERSRPLAEKTLWRIAQGIRRFVIETADPFIVTTQAARVPGLDKPIGTLVNGQKHSAFLAKHYGGVVGVALTQPTSTVTAKDHHGLVSVCLAAGGAHVGEVRAFLTAYYGSDSSGQQLSRPMRTITARHRLGFVTVSGVDYQIVDIGLRMLQPHELLAAQFGRFAPSYDLGPAKTKTAQGRLIGNSVCPEVAEAVVLANLGRGERASA